MSLWLQQCGSLCFCTTMELEDYQALGIQRVRVSTIDSLLALFLLMGFVVNQTNMSISAVLSRHQPVWPWIPSHNNVKTTLRSENLFLLRAGLLYMASVRVREVKYRCILYT